MPQLITKTPDGITVQLTPEEKFLLLQREERGSWGNVLDWFHRHVPLRAREVWPVISGIKAFERRYRIRLKPLPADEDAE